jgi:predicted  nucleic acid-binding Zn-ribbon protein
VLSLSFFSSEQEKLNMAVPKLEQQAQWVKERAAEASRKMAAAQANLAAVVDVEHQLKALTARLGRLQQSMTELQELAATPHQAPPADQEHQTMQQEPPA